jgi:hypothetical protein
MGSQEGSGLPDYHGQSPFGPRGWNREIHYPAGLTASFARER